MSGGMDSGQDVVSNSDPQQSQDWLLQLPAAALDVVLQQLDPRSLFSAAMSSSKLCDAALAHVNNVVLRSSSLNQDVLDNLTVWLERHRASLTSLTQCSVVSLAGRPHLHMLPCPQLRQLHLQGLKLQLEPAGGSSGVLQGCTRLTALHLQGCTVQDAHAACTAMAALPELRQLSLADTRNEQHRLLLAGLQHTSQLTHLSIGCGQSPTQPAEELSQLSALTNLQHLHLANLPCAEVPGGLPSQLVKLTCLHMAYSSRVMSSIAGYFQHFQHISSLTALQQLRISAPNCDRLSDELTGLQHLSRLTSLDFAAPGMKFSHMRTHTWARLTALQSLALRGCTLQPEALAAFTQLCALCLEDTRSSNTLEELLAAVAELQVLTELRVQTVEQHCFAAAPCPAASFTALTASTNLCSLEVGFKSTPVAWVLFSPGGTEYPHLHQINLIDHSPSRPADSRMSSVGKQQLQQMCSCCPALQSLACVMRLDRDPEASRPLLQLTALQRADIQLTCPMAPAAAATAVAAAIEVVAQLTGLQLLRLSGPPVLQKPMLMPLTALTALTRLEAVLSVAYPSPRKGYGWKEPHTFEAGLGQPPVWRQLQQELQAAAATDSGEDQPRPSCADHEEGIGPSPCPATAALDF